VINPESCVDVPEIPHITTSITPVGDVCSHLVLLRLSLSEGLDARASFAEAKRGA
jgi:hypothetical protein